MYEADAKVEYARAAVTTTRITHKLFRIMYIGASVYL